MLKAFITSFVLFSILICHGGVHAQEFDLALTLKETSLGPYVAGQQVDFDVTVYNQGSTDADVVGVIFYTPTGCTLIENNDFYEEVDGTGISNFPDYLGAGSSLTFSASMLIDQNYAGGILYPTAEIYEAISNAGLVDEDDDIDILQGSKDDNTEISTNDDIDDEYPGTPGTADNSNDIDDYDLEEIFVGYGTISGQVFEDTDGDGIGDLPLSGVLIEAYDAYNFPYSDVTGQNGEYSFIIFAGSEGFSIFENDLVGYSSVSDAQGSNDNSINGIVLPNQTITGLNFVDKQSASNTDDFDLALTVRNIGPSLYQPGDTIDLEVEIYNQGTLEADIAEAILYVPTGTTFVQGGNWTIYNTNNARSPSWMIPAGQTRVSTLRLAIDFGYTGTVLYPTAEILEAYSAINQTDEDGDLNIDVGTHDDSSEINTNDDIDDENPNYPGTIDNPNDHDEYDLEVINVDQTPFYDMAFGLTAICNDENGDGLAQAGETLIYTASLTNTGNQILDSIEFGGYQIFTANLTKYNVAPGESFTYISPYVLKIEDVIIGSVTQLVTATGNYTFTDPVNTSYSFSSSIHRQDTETKAFVGAPGAIADPMIETDTGDVVINEAENGVILKSPAGNCFRIRVEDDGTLISEPINCP